MDTACNEHNYKYTRIRTVLPLLPQLEAKADQVGLRMGL